MEARFEADVRQILHLVTHSLYSDKSVFLRELVSNASDALDRARFEALSNDGLRAVQGEAGIRISVDEAERTITLSDDELEENFIRATGPGGQKVNKTESAVQLRFNARRSLNLPNDVFLRLKKIAGRRMTGDGVIILTARRFASQERNRADARERLAELIREAAVVVKPRRATKPSRGAKERRLESKRKRSGIKKGRGRVDGFDG